MMRSRTQRHRSLCFVLLALLALSPLAPGATRGACGEGVHFSTDWVNFYSAPPHTTLNGAAVPAGSCIEAFAGGVKIGSFVVKTAGAYGFLAAYLDDPTTPEKDGALQGEAVTFEIEGLPAAPQGTWGGSVAPSWTAKGASIQVDLAAGSTATVTPTPAVHRAMLPVILLRGALPR
jgi:hypothetical protein